MRLAWKRNFSESKQAEGEDGQWKHEKGKELVFELLVQLLEK